MTKLNKNGKQIAPCIVSKVKHALKVPNRYKFNDKKCSRHYWDQTCETIGKLNGKTNSEIEKAKKLFGQYIV